MQLLVSLFVIIDPPPRPLNPYQLKGSTVCQTRTSLFVLRMCWLCRLVCPPAHARCCSKYTT